ncbi:MAG: bifunctional oligoribonuclease/PAP phosphatase NrnA [Verrucomicrobia bacterium]|nr:MAG: bifunctional oligoribonuclease/PAP phosphatase NrnA [Verrucomicrobiota bacterium]PYL45571.1 MAG: bifunctional oligoribonuclease/PAP phosphatase NrnA [Verrucomicrobiota bacterium]
MNERDTKFAEIGRVLREHNKFAVLSHVRPDGDALGSTLALALSLKGLGKEVRAWNEEGMLEKYNFLAQAELLTQPPSEPENFDVVVALDTAVQNRLGTTTSAVRHAKLWINIDHHPSNPRYGDLVYIDPTAPATGQILFEFLTNQNFPITPEIAENLYAAISTDTGSFQYPNTTVRTFEIAAELVRCGVEVGRISQLLYENFPRRRIELLRELLGTMQFGCDRKLAWFSLSKAAALALGVIPEDNEGLIDHLRATRGVIVAIFFEELIDGKVRVSMRSKNEVVDVCAICTQFGGGGHVLAAGARVRGTLPEVEKKIVEQACAAIERNT